MNVDERPGEGLRRRMPGEVPAATRAVRARFSLALSLPAQLRAITHAKAVSCAYLMRRRMVGSDMLDYEGEQTLVIACILDHLRKVGIETEAEICRIAEQAGFKERAIVQGLRRLTSIEMIRPVDNSYEIVVKE